MKLKTLCLTDQSFQKSFPDWEKFIKEIIEYINSALKETKFELKPTIKKWETKNLKRTYNSHFLSTEEHRKKYHLVIGFTNKLFLLDHPFCCGMSYKKNIIIAKFFPIKIPLLYKYGLKKLTLHELGHFLELNDSFFTKISIMDNFFGTFTSRFTKKQIEAIKRTPRVSLI